MPTIRLSWDKVDGAVSYNIYHSTQSGLSVAFTPLLVNTAQLTFDHTGLVVTSVHYYRVAAVGPNNEIGPPSVEFSLAAGSLVSIAVTPSNPSLSVPNTQQMTATATYSDTSTADITGSVTWSSGTPADATISAGGLVTAVATGSSIITATFGLISGNTTVTVL